VALPPLQTLERSFGARTRTRGELYFRQGRVRLRRLDEAGIAAVVRGTNAYEVQVRFDPPTRRWQVSCTCRAFADAGPCKHLWATITAGKAAGATASQEDGGSPSASVPLRPPHSREELLSRLEKVLAASGDTIKEPPFGSAVPAGPQPSPDPGEPFLRDLRALVRLDEFRHRTAPEDARLLSYVLAMTATGMERTARVLVRSQRLQKRGGWTAPRPYSVREHDGLDHLNGEDREILALLRGASGEGLWTYGRATSFTIPGPMQAAVLTRMAATGRLHLGSGQEDAGDPLTLDAGGPFDFGISIARTPGGSLELEGFLARGGERLRLESPIEILEGGLLVREGRIARVDWRGAWECAVLLYRQRRFGVTPDRAREVLGLVPRLPGEARLDAPGILREISGPPRPRLVVDAPDGGASASAWAPLMGRVEFEYGTRRVATDEPAATSADGDTLVRILRDPQAEAAAWERLLSLGGLRQARGEDPPAVLFGTKGFPAVASTLLGEGWTVEAEGRPCRTGGSLRLKVRSGIDWFEVSGAAEFGSAQASLPDLLRAIRSGSRLVRLSDGGYGLLPEKWLAGWGLAGAGAEHEGSLRFHKNQAWLIDLLLAERGEVDVDAAFRKARVALRRFERFEPAREPEPFRGELRPYQREGLGWLRLLRELGLGGCLADDMGLGKTVQVLALLAEKKARRRRPSLVVAPRSVVFNWLREAERFAPELSVAAHHGPGRARTEKLLARHDLVVTTYGTLRRDVELLSRVEFRHAILDEAQMIKNASSQSAKAARLLRAEHRLVLTGTPVENHLDDLWSLFEFLNPGMLGRSQVFRAIVAPAGREEPQAEVGAPHGPEGDRAAPAAELGRALRPFLLRRTKEQVLADLPPKTEQVVSCDQKAEERRRYEELRDHYRASLLARVDEEGLEKSRMHVLEALLRLRQAACHPGLLDASRSGEGSAKLDALLPMLEELRESGHKALVFSQFTGFLAIVRARLDAAGAAYEYLDGRTRKREEKVRRFQEEAGCPLFLISLKAGGFGLNLTAADYVFLLDPWWNPAVERQAIDRTHRIGQTRAVNAYRLVSRGTIEEKVLELQERKRELAEAILSETQGTLRDLTRADLEQLLS